MTKFLDPLFATPIYGYQTEFELTLELERFIRSLPYQENKFNIITKSTRVLDMPELEGVRKIIQTSLDEYVDKTFNCLQEFYINDSWIAINQHIMSHQKHNHQNSIISGVFYLKATPNSGSINFYKEPIPIKEAYHFDYDIKEYNFFNSSKQSYPPKTGLLVIFPSHVQHSVDMNSTENDRFALAFNAFVRGFFGNNNYASNLTIV